MSGGVHANARLNQRIREIPGVEEVFVYPNMGDGGCGTGAAMLVFGHDRMPKSGFDNVYFGLDNSEAEIRAALDAEGLKYERFDNVEERIAEFMTITFDCTDEMKGHSPAAVHVDGTARPQLVRPESNPSFYRILNAYEARTGIPVLINTSFNMHEEPIIRSVQDAVRAFLLGNLDYLAAGPFLCPHPKLDENLRGRKASKSV
jgi:predicted NodU family carbamoyl transferase